MQKRQVRGIAALVGTAGLSVGVAGAQPLVIDWLAPTTGLWSNPANWSGANVPDSLEEAARISPPAGRGIEVPVALVDGSFEVEELTGNGVVEVVIQNSFTLRVGSLISGVEGFTLIVGDDSNLDDPARLELAGTRRGSTTFINNASILLAGGNSEVISEERTSVGADASIFGDGRISGEFSNLGTIGSFFGGTLTIADAEVTNSGNGTIDGGGTVRFERSLVRFGTIAADAFFESTVVSDAQLVSGVVQSPCTFADVEILSSLVVNDRLGYLTTTGEFPSAGGVVINGPGRIEFDDTPENTLILGEGTIRLTDDNGGLAVLQAQADDEVFVLPDAVIEGRGRVVGDVVSLGTIDAAVVDFESPVGTLEVLGDFTQLGLGEVVVGVAQRLQPSPGDIGVQRFQINSGDVSLDGDLVVRYFVLEPDRIAGVPFRVVQHRNPNDAFIFDGEFDRVTIDGLPAGLSPLPQVVYAVDGVDVTLFCLADTNRDGSVNPADFSAWVRAFNEDDLLADQNLDGDVGPSDFNAWVTNFNGGCGR
ncbi:MAG: GC-type dockerin domain-anchored protein [Planctomycetota bacterium]